MTNMNLFRLPCRPLPALVALGGFAYAGIRVKQPGNTVSLTYKVHQAEHDWNRRCLAQHALRGI